MMILLINCVILLKIAGVGFPLETAALADKENKRKVKKYVNS